MTDRTLNDYIARIASSETRPTPPDPVASVTRGRVGNATYPDGFIESYSRWTSDLWAPAHPELDERDYAIMALGFPGEWGEVVEVLDDPSADPVNLMKEMGDMAYYWARIGDAYLLPVAALWGGLNACGPGAEQTENYAVRQMTRAVGKVSEVLKKRARDGVLNREKLHEGMEQSAAAWHLLASLRNLDPYEILTLNQRKVEGRRERNTLRGSGDSR